MKIVKVLCLFCALLTVSACGGGGSSGPSSDKSITAYSFSWANNHILLKDSTGTISSNTISVEVPYLSIVEALIAEFTATGTAVSIGGITQTSGVTQNDFTDTVTYTVTAGDSTTADYTVSLSYAALQNALLESTDADADFGAAIASSADGNVVAVGARDADGGQGAVYVHRYDGSTWASDAKLVATEATTLFGDKVVISADGNTIVSRRYNNSGDIQAAVYAYKYDGSTWSAGTRIVAADGGIGDLFGEEFDMSADGNVLAVQGGNKQGVYVFNYDGTSWDAGTKLFTSDSSWSSPVAINADGTVIISGTPAYVSNQGAAYLFRYRDSGWDDGTMIVADDGVAMDYFGLSVAISSIGDRVAIGSRGNDQVGAVYIYDLLSSSPEAAAKLEAVDGEGGDNFGDEVHMSADGDIVFVPARGKNYEKGAVYVFRRTDSGWDAGVELAPATLEENDAFGAEVGISADGNRMVSGAERQGAAYLFIYSGSSWDEGTRLTPSTGTSGYGEAVWFSSYGNAFFVGARGSDTVHAYY